MSYYDHEIFKKMVAKDWPEFDRPEFLGKLNRMADRAYNKGNINGYLSSVLIYQQLIEEMIDLLVELNNLLIKGLLFPFEVDLKTFEDKTLGTKIQAIGGCVSFDSKSEVISFAGQFNSVRRELVHNLTKKKSLKAIKESGKKIKKYFDKFFSAFETAEDHLRASLSDVAQNHFDAVYGDEFSEY